MSKTSQAPSSEFEATRALARSVLWQAVALGLGPPGPKAGSRFAAGDGIEALAEAAALVDEGLVPRVRALGASGGPSEPEFARLFGFTSRGKVSPYETAWGPDNLFLKPNELADISGFLAAFGLTLNRDRHERVDHLGCEAELMAFLATKQARCLDEGRIEEAEVAERAQKLLLSEHLGRFVPAFSRALAREDRDGFYGRLGELLHELCLAECARFAVEAGSPSLTLRPTDMDDEPMTCGGASELIQLEKKARSGQSSP